MGGAVFSACGRYRYRLWRDLDVAGAGAGRVVAFVLLNPSTATAEHDDPTIRRCVALARRRAAARVEVVNLFAWRSTEPAGLVAAADPIGRDNDAAILAAVRGAALVVVGWGRHGALHDRAAEVAALLADARARPRCLARNADGSPTHPLYQPNAARLRPWTPRCGPLSRGR